MQASEFPMSLPSFERQFPDEQACRQYLAALRWPRGFVCPRCGARDSYVLRTRPVQQCKRCAYQASLTAGTIFHGSRRPLRHWYLAIFLFVTCKSGISARQLSLQLGLGYKTAWSWLHKLRRVLATAQPPRLTGLVEVDETVLGGTSPGQQGFSGSNKTLLLIAVEDQSRNQRQQRCGPVVLKLLHSRKADAVRPAVAAAVQPGAEVKTDGLKSYLGLADDGYLHRPTTLKRNPRPATEVFPLVHRVASRLKRVLLGTYHGGVKRWQLPAYLAEFQYRFNRRAPKIFSRLFFYVCRRAAQTPPVPYRQLINREAEQNQGAIQLPLQGFTQHLVTA